MQENKERLETRDEQVQNDKEEISDVMANQTSLFDNDEVFTEAMVVEKQPVDIDSTPDSSSETKENGVSDLVRKNCDYVASLPMRGNVNSLNVSTASAVLLYEAIKQRGYK